MILLWSFLGINNCFSDLRSPIRVFAVIVWVLREPEWGQARSLFSSRKSQPRCAVTDISTSELLKVVVKSDQQFCAGKKADARNDSGHAKD